MFKKSNDHAWKCGCTAEGMNSHMYKMPDGTFQFPAVMLFASCAGCQASQLQ